MNNDAGERLGCTASLTWNARSRLQCLIIIVVKRSSATQLMHPYSAMPRALGLPHAQS